MNPQLFYDFGLMKEETSIDEAKKRTLKLSVIEGMTWSVMCGAGEFYFAPFALFLGAGNTAIAVLHTMPHWLGAMAQLLGAHLTDTWRRRRAILVIISAVQAVLFIPLFMMPYFLDAWSVPLALLFAGAIVFCGNAVVPAWTSMMGEVVADKERGDYFGGRARLVILVIFLTNLVAGGILALCTRFGHTWIGFGTIFMMASVARMVSARLLVGHYDPPYTPAHEAYFSFADFVTRVGKSNFTRFAFYFAVMIGSVNIAAPFFAVYVLRDLQWSYAQFSLYIATFLGTQCLAIRWWGRMGDRHGNRSVLAAAGCILSFVPLLWTLHTSFVYILLVQVCGGIGWSGFTIGAQNFLLDAVTPDKRARVTSYTCTLNGMASLLGGTLIGSWLANHLPASYAWGGMSVTFLSSLPAVFIVSTMARLTATIMMVPKFSEVRDVEAVHPVRLILRISGGQAVAGFLSNAASRFVKPRKND